MKRVASRRKSTGKGHAAASPDNTATIRKGASGNEVDHIQLNPNATQGDTVAFTNTLNDDAVIVLWGPDMVLTVAGTNPAVPAGTMLGPNVRAIFLPARTTLEFGTAGSRKAVCFYRVVFDTTNQDGYIGRDSKHLTIEGGVGGADPDIIISG